MIIKWTRWFALDSSDEADNIFNKSAVTTVLA